MAPRRFSASVRTRLRLWRASTLTEMKADFVYLRCDSGLLWPTMRSSTFVDTCLVACRNPELARLRTHKREDLLAAIERNLDKIKAQVDAGKLAGRDEIGLRVGKVINQYKMAKHFK